jgi:hypothetical protein
MNIGRSSTGAIGHYDAEEPMTETPTPATGGEARWSDMGDDDLVDSLFRLDRTPRQLGAIKDELLRRLRRATPAADKDMRNRIYTALVALTEPWPSYENRSIFDFASDGADAIFAVIAAADPAPGEGENEDDIVTTGHWMDKPEGFSP